jgi:hypothetical protein
MKKLIMMGVLIVGAFLSMGSLGVPDTHSNPNNLVSNSNSKPYLHISNNNVMPEQITTPTPTVRPTTTSCSPDQVVENLQKKIPYDVYTLSYIIIDGKRQLFFWIVDPNINPAAKKEDLRENFELAVTDAIALSYDMKKSDKCVSELFDYINPVVVDINHNGWFSGLIATEDISDNPDFIEVDEKTQRKVYRQDDFDVTLQSLYSNQVWERENVPEIQQIPEGSCSWSEVQKKVNRHFYTSPLNVNMLNSDNSGLTFTIQYKSKMDDPLDEIEVFLNTAREISCIQPAVDSIFVVIVGTDGKWLSTKKFPLKEIQKPATE